LSNQAQLETTPSYIELASQGYRLFLEAGDAAWKRHLTDAQEVLGIIARPHSATTPENALREGIDRLREISERSVAALHNHGTANTELAEKVVAHASRVGETIAHGVRGLANLNLTNLANAKATTETQFDIITRGVEDVRNRATAQAAQAAQASRSTSSTVTAGTATGSSANSPSGKN
jgi:hypothetical protein